MARRGGQATQGRAQRRPRAGWTRDRQCVPRRHRAVHGGHRGAVGHGAQDGVADRPAPRTDRAHPVGQAGARRGRDLRPQGPWRSTPRRRWPTPRLAPAPERRIEAAFVAPRCQGTQRWIERARTSRSSHRARRTHRTPLWSVPATRHDDAPQRTTGDALTRAAPGRRAATAWRHACRARGGRERPRPRIGRSRTRARSRSLQARGRRRHSFGPPPRCRRPAR